MGQRRDLPRRSFHQRGLILLSLCFIIQQLFNVFAYRPDPIDRLAVHCIHRSSFEHLLQARPLEQGETHSLDNTLRLMSWDFSPLMNGALIESEDLKTTLFYLKTEISRAINGGRHRERPLSGERLGSEEIAMVVVNLQGVSREMIHPLKRVLIEHGGCWAYAPQWETPSWINLLSRALGSEPSSLYEALLGSQSPYDHGLWAAVIGLRSDIEVSAERWGLPARPGRWPQRLFYPQTAALAVTVAGTDLTRQVINLSFPDARQRHQAGALALQSLNRSPLIERFRSPWVMVGDWRANPPNSEPHPEVAYRFQRYSLEGLHKYSALFSGDSEPRKWGRWRSSSRGLPSVIDLAYSSGGVLRPYLNSPYADPLYPGAPNPSWWIGEGEQRSILTVDWSFESSRDEK